MDGSLISSSPFQPGWQVFPALRSVLPGPYLASCSITARTTIIKGPDSVHKDGKYQRGVPLVSVDTGDTTRGYQRMGTTSTSRMPRLLHSLARGCTSPCIGQVAAIVAGSYALTVQVSAEILTIL